MILPVFARSRLAVGAIILYILVIGGAWRGILDPTWASFSLAAMALLSTGWFVLRMSKGWRWHPTVLDRFLPVWLFVFAVSTLANNTSIQQISVGLWFAGFYVLAWYTIHDTIANRLLNCDEIIDGLLMAGAVTIATALVQRVVGPDPRFSLTHWDLWLQGLPDRIFYLYTPAVRGLMANPNILGAYLTFITPLAIGRATGQNGSARWLMATYSVGAVLALFFSGSRGAQLGAAVAIVVLLANISPYLILLALLGGAFVAYQLYSLRGDDGRFPLYIHAMEVFLHQPLTGSGLFTYRFTADDGNYHTYYVHAHNLLLQIAAELGIPGLIALALTVINFARTAWKNRRSGQFAVILALVALGTQQLVDFTLMTPSIALTGLIGLCIVTAIPNEQSQASSFRWPEWVLLMLAVILFAIGLFNHGLPETLL